MKAVINGTELGFEVLGEAGIPLVLIHGFGLDRTIWRNMIREYMPHQFVILPDVRGHGESDAPVGPYTMNQLADDLAGLLKHLSVDKAIVCGHSMGGYISLAFAERHYQQLAGLGLITSRAQADSEAKRKSRYDLIERILKRGAVELAEALAPRLSKDETIISATYDKIKQTSPMGLIGATRAMAERPDRMDLLPQLSIPALVVAGVEDQIVELGDAEEMATEFPDASFLAIPDAGHMPMWENPFILAEGLLDLIKRVNQ